MNRFINSEVINGIKDITFSMWNKGWDEANGGNVSYILSNDEISELKASEILKNETYKMSGIPTKMIGKYIVLTASGSHFRTLKEFPTRDIGVIQLLEGSYRIVWGFEEKRKPTSELYMHLLSHNARLKVDTKHKVVVHNHAKNATALSLIVDPDDRSYTLPLWKVLTESIVVFPDGIGVLPWEVPGTEEIGKNTAKKLLKSRIVVWTYHGILATGSSFQDCFGLIETVDKAAEIYMQTLKIKNYQGLTEQNLRDVCKMLNVEPREDIISK